MNKPRPVIGMLRGTFLTLLANGNQTRIDVGCMIYAAELAEAINRVTFEHTATDEEKAAQKEQDQ